MTIKIEKATFAAGCFWGVEDAFMHVPGVLNTTVGYTGGKLEYQNPSYKQVCSGDTDHAEAVEIEFNPIIVSYEKLLQVFWSAHNPTMINRQGPDVGSQYRSAIFFHSQSQKISAELSRENLQKSLPSNKTVVTQIVKAPVFYPAEEYHQKYFKKSGLQSCHILLNPSERIKKEL